jgi:hypothetical protein
MTDRPELWKTLSGFAQSPKVVSPSATQACSASSPSRKAVQVQGGLSWITISWIARTGSGLINCASIPQVTSAGEDAKNATGLDPPRGPVIPDPRTARDLLLKMIVAATAIGRRCFFRRRKFKWDDEKLVQFFREGGKSAAEIELPPSRVSFVTKIPSPTARCKDT